MNEVRRRPATSCCRPPISGGRPGGWSRPIHGRLESENSGAGAPSSGKAAAHDAAHRHAADEPAVATILTTDHDIHPPHHPPQRRPHLRGPRHRGRRAQPRRQLRHNALMTAAHADPSRHVSIRCAPRHQPAWSAVDPSTPTTHST